MALAAETGCQFGLAPDEDSFLVGMVQRLSRASTPEPFAGDPQGILHTITTLTVLVKALAEV